MKNLSTKQQIVLFLGSVVVIAAIGTFSLYQFDSALRSHILKAFTIFSIFYILFPFLRINSNWIVCYFFCFDRNWWNKKIQRPRIFIYIIYFILFFSILFARYKSNVDQYTKITISFIQIYHLIIGIIVLGKLIWTKKFEIAMLPQIKEYLTNDIIIKKMNSAEINDIIKANRENVEESSIEDLKLFLEGNEIKNKIKWIGTSGKKVVTYTGLFFLNHSILENGNNLFKRDQKRKFLQLICDNFEKYEDMISVEIKYNNLNSSYSSFNLNKYSN